MLLRSSSVPTPQSQPNTLMKRKSTARTLQEIRPRHNLPTAVLHPTPISPQSHCSITHNEDELNKLQQWCAKQCNKYLNTNKHDRTERVQRVFCWRREWDILRTAFEPFCFQFSFLLKQGYGALQFAQRVAHPNVAPICGQQNSGGFTFLGKDVAYCLRPACTCELVRYFFLLFRRK